MSDWEIETQLRRRIVGWRQIGWFPRVLILGLVCAEALRFAGAL